LILFLAFKSIQRARDVQLWKVTPVDHSAITSIVTGESKSRTTNNGVVEVDSEPGKGTTFRIKLPRNPVNGREGEQIPNRAYPAGSPG
jgi:hypothetical protein